MIDWEHPSVEMLDAGCCVPLFHSACPFSGVAAVYTHVNLFYCHCASLWYIKLLN